MNEIDAREFRDMLGRFASGIVVVTAMDDAEPVGFAAQSFVSLSLEPPLVAFCPAKTSTSWPRMRSAGHFCVNVLGAHQQSLCAGFARSGGDKFAGVSWQHGVTGAPILDGVLAWVDCVLEAEHDAGDHTIAVGRVRGLAASDDDVGPLLFWRGRYGGFVDDA